MHPVLEEMSRLSGCHSEPDRIQGRVLRRWVDALIGYTASLEETIHRQDAEIALLKGKKGKAA